MSEQELQKRHMVKRIDEDIDFGCEERPDDLPIMVIVTLVDSEGVERILKIEDALLLECDINENDWVYFDENEKMVKAE